MWNFNSPRPAQVSEEDWADFKDSVKEALRSCPELRTDPVEMARAIGMDAELVKSFPQLPYARRLQIISRAVRSGGGEPIELDADRAMAFEQMRASRGPREMSTAAAAYGAPTESFADTERRRIAQIETD